MSAFDPINFLLTLAFLAVCCGFVCLLAGNVFITAAAVLINLICLSPILLRTVINVISGASGAESLATLKWLALFGLNGVLAGLALLSLAKSKEGKEDSSHE